MTDQLFDFKLTMTGVDHAGIRVLEFEATEIIFSGCVVKVSASVPAPLTLSALLGSDASFEIARAGTSIRTFHGCILAGTVEASPHSGSLLEVEIGAHVELLKLGKNSRIFQHKSVVDIVTSVLTDAGLSSYAIWRTSGSYAARDYVVQYDESDFDFVTRILQEEGISFAIHNDDSSDTIVLYDDSTQLAPIDGDATLHERDNYGASAASEAVWDITDRSVAASDQVMLRDYDPKRPSFDLSATEKSSKSTGREVYEHPGNFTDLQIGKSLAKRRLEALRAGSRVMHGRSNCPRLEAGRAFTMDSHKRSTLNIEQLILRVVHRGNGAFSGETATTVYENDFVSMPRSVPHRPTEAAPAPALGGTQFAFVTCPPGEEIHTEELGRVKVRFPWDRSGLTDDKSSTWLRVGQLALGGSMILPRGDFEVIVDFEFGDIDRPVVTGHLYNGGATVPYSLPGAATRSSIQSATTSGGPGANELRFEDSAGSEEIFLNASKDFTISVAHDATWMVSNNETVTIGSNSVLSVGTDHAANVKTDRSLSVGAIQAINVGGDFSDVTGGSEKLSIGAVRHVKCGGDHVEDCTGTLDRTVAALQCVTAIAGYQRKVAGNSTVKVGAAWTEVCGASRASACGGSRTETIGALKMIKAKQMALSCGAAYTANAGSYSVQCGGSRTDSAKAAVAITAGGGMSVKASNIVIEAKNKLVMVAGGVVIKLSKAGEVSIKAATIDLTGVKALNQIMHKSN